MRRLFLVRHGRTKWTEQRRYCGISDVALSPRGQAEATLLGERDWPVSSGAIYTSPLLRCRETADRIAHSISAVPQSVAGLREIDFGRWEGLTFGEVERRYPEDAVAFLSEPNSFAFPGGESVPDFHHRVQGSLDTILRASMDAVVVAHGGSLRSIVASLGAADPNDVHGLPLEPAEVLRMHFDRGIWSLWPVNDFGGVITVDI